MHEQARIECQEEVRTLVLTAYTTGASWRLEIFATPNPKLVFRLLARENVRGMKRDDNFCVNAGVYARMLIVIDCFCCFLLFFCANKESVVYLLTFSLVLKKILTRIAWLKGYLAMLPSTISRIAMTWLTKVTVVIHMYETYYAIPFAAPAMEIAHSFL